MPTWLLGHESSPIAKAKRELAAFGRFATPPNMHRLALILTALLLATFTGLKAEQLRPVERSEAARLALAVVRPLSRPDYMVRLPVTIETREPEVRPLARSNYLPEARWDRLSVGRIWTRAVMSAISAHGDDLENTVPRDIDKWCPAYEANGPEKRRAFWVGMISLLARYESTYRPDAVGGGGRWYGLMQILPSTARHFGCRATYGEALKVAEDNLACAIRIMNVTVPRDNAIAQRDSRWRGVAADWGPMTDRSKIDAMASWTSAQSYCTTLESVRPLARPITIRSQ